MEFVLIIPLSFSKLFTISCNKIPESIVPRLVTEPLLTQLITKLSRLILHLGKILIFMMSSQVT